MLESSFRNLVAAKHLPDPLVAQLRRFTTRRTSFDTLRPWTSFIMVWIGP